MVPLMSYLKNYNAMTIKKFAEQFKQQLLQLAFQFTIPNKYCTLALFYTLSSMSSNDSGWPIEAHFRTRVNRPGFGPTTISLTGDWLSLCGSFALGFTCNTQPIPLQG